MDKLYILFFTLMIFGCSKPEKIDWIKESNQLALQFAEEYSELYPEHGSALGDQKYDAKGFNLTEDLEKNEEALLKKWVQKIESKLLNVKEKNLRADLKILLDKLKLDLEGKALMRSQMEIPFYTPSKDIYSNLQLLINKQSSAKRKNDAVTRFKYYMSDKDKLNIIDAYREDFLRTEKRYPVFERYYQYKGKIEGYLEDSPFYVKGVKELLSNSGRNDWQDEFKLFKLKVSTYDEFIKNYLLPRARKFPKRKIEDYQLSLKSYGVDETPDKLIEIGRKEYKTVYKKFEETAKNLSKKYKLKKSDPASVIAHLKQESVTSLEDVSNLYNSASDRLEGIIRANDLVTLPKKKLVIRFAGDAESKAQPVPHLIPPPLIDNNGVLPEFVVPTSSTGKLPFDDFSYKSAATILTAHEGRPGHDLQFSMMLENPVTIIRSRYGMTSTNAEGWGLYAEDLVYNWLTDEEKLVAQQTRLWRIARYFLDPSVQLGKIGAKEVVDLFTKELGVSEVMAKQEYDRYASRNPGQATSYFHGLLKIKDLKKHFTENYGNLNIKCFNDTLLSFGVLPHKIIKEFKEQFKTCALK